MSKPGQRQQSTMERRLSTTEIIKIPLHSKESAAWLHLKVFWKKTAINYTSPLHTSFINEV